jgi:pimeloyl-ACP methyl ester carboxylesterase
MMRTPFATVTFTLVLAATTSAAEPGVKGAVRERIEFENGKSKLVGDLLLPKGDGPFPVFIFVHGAGATPRNCNGYYVPIWDRLLKQGYACLSWDKPGVGESTGDWKTQSMADRQREVRAALQLLKKRKDIDPKRLGLWGSSQAGLVVPELAAQGDVSFAILVSPAHANVLEVTRRQITNELFLRFVVRIAREDVKEVSAFLQETLQRVERKAPYAEMVAALKAAEAKPWFAALERMGVPTSEKLTPQLYEQTLKEFTLDPRPTLEKITCPMLVIFGSEDIQVNPVSGVKTFEKAAKKAENKDVTIHTFAGADHDILIEEKGKRRISPDYLDLMERWAAEQARRGNKP